MSLFLFLIVIVVSFIAIKVGAVAFEITGLNSKQAIFQALSAFTGTGFTTKEAELIASHEQRRKIASALMIFGNAGLVTLIATLVNSISEGASSPVFFIPHMDKFVPGFFIPYINFAFILFAVFIVYKFIKYTKIGDYIMKQAKKRMLDKHIIKPVSFEEFLITSGGYGISQVEIQKNNPLLGRTLAESQLKQQDILVLSIERSGQHITNPVAETKINLGDRLVCFGKFDNVRKAAYAAEETA